MHAPLLWCDIETSGLSENEDRIFELALALTDGDLRELASFEVVLGWRDPWSLPMPDIVREMHTRSGLLKEVAVSKVCVREAEDRALAWIREHGADGLYMAGSGVHFDRRWLRHLMPQLAGRFHYRNFDITTLRYFFGAEKSNPAHRALADVRGNMEDVRGYAAAARAAGLVAIPGAAVVAVA